MAVTYNFLSGNRLLEALPPESIQTLAAILDPVTTTLGEKLLRSGEPIEHVYFPTAGYASLLVGLSTGLSSEVSMTGCDGMIGAPLVLCQPTSLLTAMVQCAGSACRMTTHDFQIVMKEDRAFSALMTSYCSTLMMQMALTAACNCKHSIRQRLARWILMARGRSNTDTMPMTQEMLSMILGSHRPSITEAATSLRKMGAIHYIHGQVEIIDRAALELQACECYFIDTSEQKRMFKNSHLT